MNRVRLAQLVARSRATASILLVAVSMATAQSTTAGTARTGGRRAAPARPAPTGSSQTADPRSAVAVQGLGTFLYGDATLTVYGCFRTGTRVLCDFDFTKQRNAQVHTPWVWGRVSLIDDGGKVTRIHNGFFMGQDGSQFPTAYVSTTPVRMIMEYDDVAPNFNSVALVLGRNRVQGVPITTADSTQPAGTIPGRGAASTQGTGAAPGGASNPVDSATNAVNKATNTINDTKQKGKAALDSLKGATAK